MIVTLSGSGRFKPWYTAWDEALSLAGHTVFGLNEWPEEISNKQKYLYNEVRLSQIEESDALMVLNVFAYIGEDSLIEIDHAFTHSKTIIALESWGKDNGISINHFAEVQKTAKAYNVYGKGSPIDTTRFKHPWDLLGPGGNKRNDLVKQIKEKEAVALGYNPALLNPSW